MVTLRVTNKIAVKGLTDTPVICFHDPTTWLLARDFSSSHGDLSRLPNSLSYVAVSECSTSAIKEKA